MEAILSALVSELRRLKATGVRSVNLAPETLNALREAIALRSEARILLHEPERESVRPESIAVPIVHGGTDEKSHSEVPGRTMPLPQSFALPRGTKRERMDWLIHRVTTDEVCRSRIRPGKKVVVGTGSLDAKIFFCGEAPGSEEEIAGEPFVGPAGQLLNRMIQAMGLNRSDVYIGNIMNWRPELPTAQGHEQVGNRPPTAEELTYCLPYLKAQLEVVEPMVVVALGSTAAQGLFGVGSFKTLGEIRGRWKLFGEMPVMVTYHPSYILRNTSNRSKRAIWEDLLKVMERVGAPISERQRNYFLEQR